ncbi:transmembrane protein 114 isoform X2 [Electrophorus electricus]|uniref:transmembrane protein 114 isoform X2 n=1 Tax=Electrophorus electricus TaxID=8005 RepID=UPI000F0A4AF5|nr:transmembrane protein 114 isoform X2 [Electrophorus electricus]
MKFTLSVLAVFVASFGVISFVCLVLAIGTDFWYIIDTSKRENNSVSLSSHSGLWRTCNVDNQCWPFVNPFRNRRNFTDSQRQILNMQGAFIVLLPLSVIVLFIGGMLGVISMLAKAHLLLLATGALLLCGAAFEEAVCLSGHQALQDIGISFGWSLVLAALSSVTELLTAVAFLLASARVGQLTQRQEEVYAGERETLGKPD